MSFITKAINDATEATGCRISCLSLQESSALRERIEDSFASSSGHKPLWERLAEDKSKYDPNGWKLIEIFPYKDTVTMFFDEQNESAMYHFNSCEDIVKVLSECPGFVFYLTDSDCSFLVCHNDHDYLIGAGAAKDWITLR